MDIMKHFFLVPYSCRATERNGNSISADVTDNTIENNENDARFSQFQTIWRCYTYIVVLWNSLENLTKGLLFYLFLKLVQINYIFSNNVRILYIYFTRTSSSKKSLSVWKWKKQVPIFKCLVTSNKGVTSI